MLLLAGLICETIVQRNSSNWVEKWVPNGTQIGTKVGLSGYTVSLICTLGSTRLPTWCPREPKVAPRVPKGCQKGPKMMPKVFKMWAQSCSNGGPSSKLFRVILFYFALFFRYFATFSFYFAAETGCIHSAGAATWCIKTLYSICSAATECPSAFK